MKPEDESAAYSTTEIARKTIPFMSRKGIPLSPNNYRIWFEYFRGRMTELKETIDGLLDKGAVFDDALHEELYGRFLSRDFDAERESKLEKEIIAVEKANRASSELLSPIVKNLGDFSSSASRYSAKLDSLISEAAGAGGADEFAGLLDAMITETESISRDNKSLTAELERSTLRLEELRVSLDLARAEARLDDLTRLSNRRAFNEKLDEQLRVLRAGGHPACVAIIDIDHFKRINDTYGHPVGDKALRVLSKQLNESLGENDLLFRYGGEEFSVIMKDTQLARAVERLEQVRGDVAEHELVIREKVERLTVSIGVAAVDADATREASVQAADNALYLAKNSGRNNVKSEKDLEKTGDAARA